MRQPLPSLIFSANQVRGALMPRDPVVVVTAPENITNILPTAQLLTEQHVESERERKSRVELTIQQKCNICASLDAGKTERLFAQEYHLDRSTVRKLYKKSKSGTVWCALAAVLWASVTLRARMPHYMRPEPTCCKLCGRLSLELRRQ